MQYNLQWNVSFNRYLGVVLLHQFSVRYDENFIQKGIFLVDVDVEILIVIIFQLTQKSDLSESKSREEWISIKTNGLRCHFIYLKREIQANALDYWTF